jgi:hypothetical protein
VASSSLSAERSLSFDSFTFNGVRIADSVFAYEYPAILRGKPSQVIGNKFNIVKKRFVLWTSFVLVASIATAGSFHIPTKHMWTDSENAKSLGVSVQEYKKVWRMSCHLGSDIHNHRPIRQDEVEYLFAATEKNPKLAAQVIWSFRPLRETAYKPRVIEFAYQLAQSKDENEAFAAIDTLKHFGDPRWKGLAEAFPWQCEEYSQLIMEPRRY